MAPTPRMRFKKPCVTCTARMCLSETEVRSLLKMNRSYRISVSVCERRLPGVDVPVEQGQHAKPDHRNENDAADEPEGMRPEHRRMRLVDHRCSRPLLPSAARTAPLFCGPTAEKRVISA